MEKKKEIKKKATKKSTKTQIKKATTVKKNSKVRKKGFTLIELLAVIIILGILMIIAIPSVTSYINDSRKNAYIDTAKEVVSGTRNIVNEGRLGMYDTNTTYYIPAKYVNTENSLKSPYGEFTDTSAYVGVIYDGQGYKYYWISSDDAGQGIDEVTPLDKLDTDLIKSDLNPDDIYDIVRTTGIGDRTSIKVLNSNGSWDDFSAEDNVSEEGGGSNSYYLYVVNDIIFNVGFTIQPVNGEPGYYDLSGIAGGYERNNTYRLYDNYLDAINSMHYSFYDDIHYDFFIRLKVSNDTIVQLDLGYRLNNKIYYIKGADPNSYNTNKNILLNSFGSNLCNINEFNNEFGNVKETSCYIAGDETHPGLYISIHGEGGILALDSTSQDFSWQCNISPGTEGFSGCLQPF